MEYPLLQLLLILLVMGLDLTYAIWDTYSNAETAVSLPSFNAAFFLSLSYTFLPLIFVVNFTG